jgi:uncharacterized membrane protein YoaK (UPF0700 family)
MFTHQANNQVPPSAYARWLLMTFGAAFMNAAAFLAAGTFVTHVTGFATLFGLHAARGQWLDALAALLVPAGFMLGALLAGFLISARRRRGLVPHYDYAMAVAGACALAPALLHWLGGLEEARLSLSSNLILLVPLCLSSGVQNAALSAASRRSVRITHLTGLSTDLGLGLAQLASHGSFKALHKDAEFLPTLLRLGTLGCFLLGSLAGALAMLRFGFSCFVFPAAACFYAAWVGRGEKSRLGRRG